MIKHCPGKPTPARTLHFGHKIYSLSIFTAHPNSGSASGITGDHRSILEAAKTRGAAADGTATFRTFIPADTLGYSWLGKGLTNPTGAEIHFAPHYHGPIIADKIQAMLSTPHEGCTEESLPEIWPANARAGGEPGPNQCTMVQFAIFKQP